MAAIPRPDLDYCISGVGPERWERLRGGRVFVTGATGIIGKWLLETLSAADQRLNLNVQIVALSRDPARFAAESPAVASLPGVTMIQGDVRDFAPPPGSFDAVIHAATDVIAPGGPLDVFDTCVQGTRRVLDFAVEARSSRLLLLSSGAVYGPQPNTLERVPEGFNGAPDLDRSTSAYGEGKRVSEWLAGAYAREHGLRANTARIYALLGPHLPLDKHFAIGNFINDSIAGREIVIKGRGSEIRCYLYLADVAIWLWRILFHDGPSTTFNVGSTEAISIADLAHRVAHVLGNRSGVRILGTGSDQGLRDRYVPDTRLAHEELGVGAPIPLDDAIERTANWHRAGRK